MLHEADNEIVLDDILLLSSGSQIVTDSVVAEGEVLVNESIITGESDSITKRVGDEILSGSFVVSGKCKARVNHIGHDNYTYQISKDAKYIKKAKSEIMSALQNLVRVVSVIIIPLGALLFWSQMTVEGNNINQVVLNVVAALIGMIPEGLVLLTSTVLAVSVRRLSKVKVLVQQLYSVETLARVDTLCLDKTGTLTENKMKVVDIVPLEANKDELKKVFTRYAYTSIDENSTILALKDYFKEDKKLDYKASKIIPFNSEVKWSAINFEDGTNYIMGAPEFITKDKKYLDEVNKHTEDYRVVLIASSKENANEKNLPQDLKILGLALITDVIRKDADEVIKYFYKEGVDLKIISGDNPKTVSKIAKHVGIKNYDKYIDMSKVPDDQIQEYVNINTVFGRVSPMQKKLLIKALKKDGKTCAMIGDGVNDVLALKEADTSVALGNGSAATKSVSELVLLDSNFASMPKVVLEGRRTINNIERSSTLFIVKTIYSFLLAFLFLFIKTPYPFQPIQLSLISIVTIGIPSFLLALEPNKERVRGNFIRNVIARAAPSSLATIFSILTCVVLYNKGLIDLTTYSTLCIIATATTGFCLLFRLSRRRKGESKVLPVSIYRFVIALWMFGMFILELLFLSNLFNIVPLHTIWGEAFRMICFSVVLFIVLNFISEKVLRINKDAK